MLSFCKRFRRIRFGKNVMNNRRSRSSYLARLTRNVSHFAFTRPPVMMFSACLTAFAAILFGLSCIIPASDELRNPDQVRDWNRFLSRLGAQQFCVTSNSSQSLPPSYTSVQSLWGAEPSILHGVAEPQPVTNFHTFSVSIPAHVVSDDELRHVDPSITALRTVVLGRQLGYYRDLLNAPINITFSLSSSVTSSFAQHISSKVNCKSGEFGKSCPLYLISMCVTLTARKEFFPQTRAPPSCSKSAQEASTKLSYMTSFVRNSWRARFQCQHDTRIFLMPEDNPSLKPLLTFADKSVAQENLIHITYVLLLVLLAILLYASCAGGRRHQESLISLTDTLSSTSLVEDTI